MRTLTDIYNKTAERRTQALTFIGKERRKLVLDAQVQQKLEAQNQAFLAGLQDIENLKRLA